MKRLLKSFFLLMGVLAYMLVPSTGSAEGVVKNLEPVKTENYNHSTFDVKIDTKNITKPLANETQSDVYRDENEDVSNAQKQVFEMLRFDALGKA